MPQLTDGTLVDALKWNAHVDQINLNTTDISNQGGRITTLETNQGTRGTNGTVYSEIGTLKTNQGTRGTNGTVYSEIESLRTELFGSSTRTVRPKCSVRHTADAYVTLNYSTDTMIIWETEIQDTDAMFTAGGSGITVPVAGEYLSMVSLNLTADATIDNGAMGVKLLKNTTTPGPGGTNEPNVLDTNTAPFNSAGEGPVVTMDTRVTLAAGDVLRVSAWHNFRQGTTNKNVPLRSGFNDIGTKWRVIYLGK